MELCSIISVSNKSSCLLPWWHILGKIGHSLLINWIHYYRRQTKLILNNHTVILKWMHDKNIPALSELGEFWFIQNLRVILPILESQCLRHCLVTSRLQTSIWREVLWGLGPDVQAVQHSGLSEQHSWLQGTTVRRVQQQTVPRMALHLGAIHKSGR